MTTPRWPVSGSRVKMTPALARSERTIFWMPTERRDAELVEAHVEAVADRARGEERGEGAADGVDHRGLAADVEERLLLAGEARARQVFGGRRRADGDIGHGLAARAGELLVPGEDLGLEVGGHRRGDHQVADAIGAPPEVVEVALVDADEQLPKRPLEVAGGEEMTIAVGGHREAVGHLHAERREPPNELAE